jgi:hypothetical protein
LYQIAESRVGPVSRIDGITLDPGASIWPYTTPHEADPLVCLVPGSRPKPLLLLTLDCLDLSNRQTILQIIDLVDPAFDATKDIETPLLFLRIQDDLEAVQPFVESVGDPETRALMSRS